MVVAIRYNAIVGKDHVILEDDFQSAVQNRAVAHGHPIPDPNPAFRPF
jgi:hypothetical protein